MGHEKYFLWPKDHNFFSRCHKQLLRVIVSKFGENTGIRRCSDDFMKYQNSMGHEKYFLRPEDYNFFLDATRNS